MVFDWKNDKDAALEGGIRETVISSLGCTRVTMEAEDGRVEGHIFRGFPQLEFEDCEEISDCVFEDCADLYFNDCRIEGCTFRRVWSLTLRRCEVESSRFEELRGESCELIALEDSTIYRCAFEDAELRDGGYLCEGYGEAMVDYCSFKNIRTDRADGELFHCEETRGLVFKHKEEYCIIDDDTCTGLDEVEIIDARKSEE